MQSAADRAWPAATTRATRRAPAGATWPLLEPRAGGAAERCAAALGDRHPALLFLAVLLAGFVAIAAIATLLGLVVVHLLVDGLGLGGPDNDVVRTFADHRTAGLTDLSAIGSAIGGAPVLPIVAGLVALAAASARQWRLAAFAVCSLALESLTYRVTAMLVLRDRPGVERLEDLPTDHSYPSGHTAASIAVYGGLALLLTSRIADRGRRTLIWLCALVLVAVVALSRLYRGMHHPLDLAGGAVVGLLALTVVVFACRVAGAASAHRRGDRPAAPASERGAA